jgi:hypothetical protein
VWEQALGLGYTQEELQQIGAQAVLYWEARDAEGAKDYLASLNLPAEAMVAVWSQLNSDFRSALKRIHK